MKLLIFTYAPAGLGHLRVTDALIHTRPKDTEYVVLGSGDELMTFFHKVTSLNPVAKKIFETLQYGLVEDIVTPLYVWALKVRSNSIYVKLLETIGKYRDLESVTIVATHPSLAVQIGAVKARLAKKTGLKIRMVVQVTDDSSQHIWVVEGADLTMAPSRLTRTELEDYARSKKIKFNCEVSPYPVSPVLSIGLNPNLGLRQTAFLEGQSDQINVVVPISGAAVGLLFLSKLMLMMDKISSRFRFLVVAKRAACSKEFLAVLDQLRQVELTTGRNDNEVVDIYEEIYKNNLVHIEITKPSEQTFKCLLPPTKVGGVILLLNEPVGRQEYDNIEFLKRHRLLLLPSEKPVNIESLDRSLRAIKLPKNVDKAAALIAECFHKGVFRMMTDKEFKYQPASYMTSEIGDNGVWLFWEKLKLLKMI